MKIIFSTYFEIHFYPNSFNVYLILISTKIMSSINQMRDLTSIFPGLAIPDDLAQ